MKNILSISALVVFFIHAYAQTPKTFPTFCPNYWQAFLNDSIAIEEVLGSVGNIDKLSSNMRNFRESNGRMQQLDSSNTVMYNSEGDISYSQNIALEYDDIANTIYLKVFMFDTYETTVIQSNSFNDGNNLIQFCFEIWSNQPIANYYGIKWEYQYNNFDKIIEDRKYTKPDSTSEWVKDFKYIRIYDDSNLLKEKVRSNWHNNNQVWINYHKEVYIRNHQGKLVEYYRYLSVDNNEGWIQELKDEYQYDGHNNLIQETKYHWNNTNSNWIATTKEEKQYDFYNNITQTTNSDWNDSLNQWVYNYKYEYQYNGANKCIEELYYIWINDNNEWSARTKKDYEYDASNNRINYTNFIYSNGQWIEDHNEQWSYNSAYLLNDLICNPSEANASEEFCSNLPTLVNHYNKDEALDEWQFSGLDEYYYSDYTGTIVAQSEYRNTMLYPNPVANELFIKTTSHNSTLRLFNSTGQLVLASNITPGQALNLSGLHGGLYFYELFEDGKKQSGKLIKK